MGSNPAELTWGDSVIGTTADGPFDRSARVITLNEAYARTWKLRGVLTINRNLNVGAGDIAQMLVTVREGVGRAEYQWVWSLAVADGEDQAPPITGFPFPPAFQSVALDVSCSAMTVDCQLQLTNGLGADIQGTASVWIAPTTPVYPPGLDT